MERRLRFDLIIALAAVAISAIAAGAAAYQTYVVNKQLSAAVWPYLALNTTYDVNRLTFQIENDGLGPAIVRSASLTIDGRSVGKWTNLFVRFPFRHGTHLAGSLASIRNGEVVRAGDTKTVLDLHGPIPAAAVLERFERKHNVSIDLCYCSLLEQCWTVHLMADDSNPRAASGCPQTASIESG